ncbi:MAG: DUF2310 family Zn-ribbon-containing protein [Planctomycetota bacterium]|jgi:predicted  nucleic acid-binding Zn ribbon protein
MILFNVKFGKLSNENKSEAVDLAEGYMATLLHSGQACGEYYLTWIKGVLNAHVMLSGRNAFATRYHSAWGKQELKKIAAYFGHKPQWVALDDDIPSRNTTWRGAPFLYLFTHAFDRTPPVCRGDNGKPIPSYLLPVSSKTRADMYFWSSSYQDHENIWTASGILEIPTYQQLADPQSELSGQGRDICRIVEKATGVPTYYYLMRYWGRRSGEEDRKCPVCGKIWKHAGEGTKGDTEEYQFWRFDFKCDRCRLVSHLATSYDDERHARIGEFGTKKARTKTSG